MNLRKLVAVAVGGIAGTLVSIGSIAIPISVSNHGADISVSYDITGQTASFDYLFSMGSSGDFIGTTMSSLGIKFGGKKKAPLLADISTTFTNIENVTGDWSGSLANVSGKGCSSGSNPNAVCYKWDRSSTPGMVIAANTSYLFEFDVTFVGGVDVAELLSHQRSIKFRSIEYRTNKAGKNERWRKGAKVGGRGELFANQAVDENQEGQGEELVLIALSEPNPGLDGLNPNAVPVPGTLVLLGLGLLGMAWTHKRRPAA